MTVRPLKEQTAQLSKFMVRQFVRGVKYKYIHLLIPDASIGLSTTKVLTSIDDNKLATFMEIMIQRSRAHILQFKRVCCIIIKFLECCEAETNYMRHLKFNLNKLIVAAFVMSVINSGVTEGDKIIQRENCYKLYSKITGLTIKELTNCCSIVRPVVVRRSRRQNALLRRNRLHGVSSSSTADISTRFTSTTLLHDAHTNPHDYNSATPSPERSGFSLEENLHTSGTPNHILAPSSTINPSLVLNTDSDASNNIHNLPRLYSNLMPTSNEDPQNDAKIDSNTDIYATELDNNSSVNFQDGSEYHHTRHNKYNQRGNGYILPSEIEQFNIMGQKLVREYFKVV